MSMCYAKVQDLQTRLAKREKHVCVRLLLGHQQITKVTSLIPPVLSLAWQACLIKAASADMKMPDWHTVRAMLLLSCLQPVCFASPTILPSSNIFAIGSSVQIGMARPAGVTLTASKKRSKPFTVSLLMRFMLCYVGKTGFCFI